MTTPADIPLNALAAAAADASAGADEEARAAGIKPAGLLKRPRMKRVGGKIRLTGIVSAAQSPIRVKGRSGIGRSSVRRKLGT